MAKRKAKYSDEEILDILNRNLAICVADKEQYAHRYKDAWLYYAGIAPEDKNETGVAPITVVRDAVEQDYQIFRTLFNSSNNSAVAVRSNSMKSSVAEAVSVALNDIAMNGNNINRKMEGFIKEALLVGTSHMKVQLIDKISDEREHSFEDWTEEQLALFRKGLEHYGFNEIVEDIKSTRTKRTTKEEREEGSKIGKDVPKTVKLLTGKIIAKARDIYPEIDYIPYEEVFIHPHARDTLDDSPYFCHRYMMQISEGLQNGWDLDLMEEGEEQLMPDPSFATTGLIVGHPHDPYSETGSSITPAPETDCFPVYEHYWYGAYKGNYPKWWKFTCTRLSLLQEPEELDELPFVSAKVMEIPNSFYGQGLYDTTRTLQDQKTKYLRMITYNAQNAAFGRYIAQEDLYDRESLLDNRPGGVVEVSDMRAIQLMPHTDISNAMKELLTDVNQRIQASMTSAGSIGDSVEKYGETAGVTMSMLIDKTEQSPKSRAATFAETGLIPLYRKLYRLLQAIKHPLATSEGLIDMSVLPKNIGLTFDVTTLTDKQQAVQNVLAGINAAQQFNGGQLPNWISSENQYEAIADYIRVGTGEKDVSKYVTDPSTIKPTKLQQYMEGVQMKATAMELKGKAEEWELKNKKTISEIAENEAKAAYTAAELISLKEQDAQRNAEELLKQDGMKLDNELKAMQVIQLRQQIDEAPVRLQMDAAELESQLIAEQANISDENYAQGATA
ncbi:TPA: hypothetical protein OUD88_002870 [Enterobacter hormaechei]|nr:hypothetical protein [Enterobacter hormaechei]